MNKNNLKPVSKSNWKPGDLLIGKHDGQTILLIEEGDSRGFGTSDWGWKCFDINQKNYGFIVLKEKTYWRYLNKYRWIVVSARRR